MRKRAGRAAAAEVLATYWSNVAMLLDDGYRPEKAHELARQNTVDTLYETISLDQIRSALPHGSRG
jgi:hypothetical protein